MAYKSKNTTDYSGRIRIFRCFVVHSMTNQIFISDSLFSKFFCVGTLKSKQIAKNRFWKITKNNLVFI